MTLWEAGHREPGIAFWPGVIKGGRVSPALISLMDLFPTFVKLAGASMPTHRSFDGIDISNVLFEGSDQGHDFLLHPNSGGHGGVGHIGAVRSGFFKGHYFSGGGVTQCDAKTAGKPLNHTTPLIFDLSKDVAEEHPLKPSDPHYSKALSSVTSVLKAFEQDLKNDNVSKVDYTTSRDAQPCCNPKNSFCRCD